MSLWEVIGVQPATAQIVLVKDPLGHGKRRPVVPTGVVLVEPNGDDDPCADVCAAPLAGGGVEVCADLEVVFGHKRLFTQLSSAIFRRKIPFLSSFIYEMTRSTLPFDKR